MGDPNSDVVQENEMTTTSHFKRKEQIMTFEQQPELDVRANPHIEPSESGGRHAAPHHTHSHAEEVYEEVKERGYGHATVMPNYHLPNPGTTAAPESELAPTPGETDPFLAVSPQLNITPHPIGPSTPENPIPIPAPPDPALPLPEPDPAPRPGEPPSPLPGKPRP